MNSGEKWGKVRKSGEKWLKLVKSGEKLGKVGKILIGFITVTMVRSIGLVYVTSHGWVQC